MRNSQSLKKKKKTEIYLENTKKGFQLTFSRCWRYTQANTNIFKSKSAQPIATVAPSAAE